MRGKRKVIGLVVFLMAMTYGSISAMADPLIFLPFRYNTWWYCTQGQGGSFSHTGSLYWAFDFDQGSSINNAANPAFGGEVISPVNGTIVEVRDGLQDFNNTATSNAYNNWGWGNTVVIEDEDGYYHIRFAHLRHDTTTHLNVGDDVEQGDYIGEVGQTGHSTNPHLHMQIMTSQNGPSVRFSFVEGQVESYEWIQSKHFVGMSVYDSNGEESLNSDLAYTTISKRGTWNSFYHRDGAVGRNYRKHLTYPYDNSYYQWNIRVAVSGLYIIYASHPSIATNDPAVKYYFAGQLARTVDQRSNQTLMRYIKFKYLNAGKTYRLRIKGTTPGRYVIADAVGVRKLY